MKRWFHAAASVAVLVGSVSAIAPAWADRLIPPEAKRVAIAPGGTGILVVDGSATRLSPAAVIYDDRNRSITPGHVPAGVVAKVLFDGAGNVRRVWILSAAEAARGD